MYELIYHGRLKGMGRWGRATEVSIDPVMVIGNMNVIPWWRHQNIFRVTGPLCGEFTGPGDFPAQRPVTQSFDVFFDLCLNKQLSKQPWGWWFETP